MHGAGAHAAAVHGVGDETAPGLIQRATLLETGRRQQRIQAAALALSCPRREHARANRNARLAR